MNVRTLLPRDPSFEVRVRDSFARQPMMRLLGAELTTVLPGEIEIILPFRADLTQQHGYVHAAAVAAIADSACGYAALTLMEPTQEVLSVEFKVNLLAPAVGEQFVAAGRVLRSGRTLTVCAADVHAERGGSRKLIAIMQATMIASRFLDDPGRATGCF
jgi:uncharacterized protein (TIGR00369 family)